MADTTQSFDNVVKPSYFSSLSKAYALQTGNSTTEVLKLLLPHVHSLRPFTSTSVVHDNAAGPGTATLATLDFLSRDEHPKEILITDNNEDMIKSAKDIFTDFPTVEARVLDSQDLEGVQKDRFTHSIMNISLFLLKDPVLAISRVRETLQEDGIAVVTTWSRFGAAHIIHTAQRAIRPDLPLMPVPPEHFASMDYLAECAEKAGFDKGKVKTFNKSLKIVEGEWLDGLRGFFEKGPLAKMARKGWSVEDEGRWMDEVERVIQEEIKEFGGVYFEGAVLIARK